MASEVPPQRGATFDYAVFLVSQANTKLFQTSVTLATGDVKWSKAGAAFSNVTNLPSEVSTTGAIVGALTTSETDTDWGILKFSDAAGAQWGDLALVIYFSARRIDDLAYPATSGRSTAIDASGQVTVGTIAAGAINAAAIATDAIDADAIADNAINAAAIADGAITAAKIATGAIDADALATDAVQEIRAEMDSNSTQFDAILTAIDGIETGSGESAETIWTYATRTLTQTAAEVAAAVSGSDLLITRAVTFSATLTGLSIPDGWEKIYFTLKGKYVQSDDDAMVQIVVSDPSDAEDGLLRLNKAAATANQGSLTVGASSVTIVLTDDATAALVTGGNYVYDIKAIVDGASIVLTAGDATITRTPTEAIA